MKKISAIGFLLMSFLQTYSQNAAVSGTAQSNSTTQEKYERNSVSYILINFPNSDYKNELVANWKNMVVADKFNNHNLVSINTIDAPYFDREDRQANAKEIVRKLNQMNVGREVIRKWFNQQKDGKFNMNLIKERGVYNATDADVIKANSGKRGRSALEDAGESLIKKSFVVVLDFKNIEKIADYYAKRKAAAGAGLMLLGALTNSKDLQNAGAATAAVADVNFRPGFRATIDVYSYKLSWNEEKSTTFYEQVWNNPKNLDTMNIPLSLVSTNQTFAENPETEDKGTEYFFSTLASRGAEFALNVASNSVDDFKVRTKIKSIKPIMAKIGLKEGLRPDQRYVMLETSLDEFGQPKDKIIGVVRATRKITDNRSISTGETEPSKFVQESGQAPYPGATLMQKNDAGFAISVGYGLNGGILGRFDLKISRLLKIPQLKIFVDYQIGGENSSDFNGFKDLSNRFFTIGLSKEYFITRNVHLEPYLAYTSTTDRTGLVAGLRIPINLFRSVQLVPSAGFSTIAYRTSFDDRINPFSVSLRFKF